MPGLRCEPGVAVEVEAGVSSPLSGLNNSALAPLRACVCAETSIAANAGNRSDKPVTGLKYYIELRQPDGILERVNPMRVFHSGDRIRLYVSSNVDGDLVIYQKQEDRPEERLYPSAGIPDANGHVTRGTDVALPSSHAWFRFDDHPGQIHLTLMLTAKKLGAGGPASWR